MPLPPLNKRSIGDLYEEKRKLEDLYTKAQANEIAMPNGDWSKKEDIRQAVDDIEAEINRRIDSLFAPTEPCAYLIRSVEWLARRAREAEGDPTVSELKQRVRDTVETLDGLEGAELEQALRNYEDAVEALIKYTADRRSQ